jgi:RNA polymerase sigma-70 factor (family 1)
MLDQDHDFIRLTSLSKGDELAFSELFNEHWEMLFKYVIRILPDEDDVADVIQETFITLWELRGKMDSVRSPKAYLLIIARNFAFRRLRERMKQSSFEERLVSFYGEADKATEQAIDEKVLSSLIDEEIDKLPSKMREVFILSRKEHLSYREIAKRLNISDQTVKKQIHNSLKYLRLKIDNEYIPYLTLLLFTDSIF